MGDGIFGNVRGRGKHAKDCFGVGESDWVSLRFGESDSKWPLKYEVDSCRDKGNVDVGSESCNCFVTTVEVFKTNRIWFFSSYESGIIVPKNKCIFIRVTYLFLPFLLHGL